MNNMKKLRKVLALVLAMAMVLGMSATAFAEVEAGTITVDNPIAEQTYTAYKIFDVTYDSSKSSYSYTIDSNSEWFSTVQAYANTEKSGLTLALVNGSTTYNVTITDDFSAPNFAKALKDAITGKTGISLTKQTNGTVSVGNLPLGYYFVSSTSGALCNLTTTNPTVTIHDKNDVPFDKNDDKEDVDIGDTVNYTITGKVPDYTGFSAYTYLITDTMTNGLTFNKNVKVTVGDNDVTEACTITYDVKENDTDEKGNPNKFTVSIPVKNYTIGQEIKVTYSAVVNKNAVAKIETNKATLTYSNDPTNNDSKTTTPEDKEKVYSSKIVINKYKSDSENIKLPGASFILYKEVTDEGATEATKYYYTWNATNKKVEWVTDKAKALTNTTDANGAASFDGLANGTYYLEETAAPAGYNLLTGPVRVTVNGANATPVDLSSLSVTMNVANSTGTELPSTGGIGTTIFYVLGGILVLGAAVLLITRKRMNAEK